jgi:hypothetical protein
MKDSFDRVTAPGYLDGLTTRSLADVRTMRAECQSLENSLSYARRLAQGRLDIVGAELARRSSGGDPADLRDLIGRLPDILADRTRAGAGAGPGGVRPPLEMSGDTFADDLAHEVDAIFNPVDTGDITALADERLDDIRERLAGYEQTASTRRHALHRVIDELQAEITRRYRTGEASVDSLLG